MQHLVQERERQLSAAAEQNAALHAQLDSLQRATPERDAQVVVRLQEEFSTRLGQLDARIATLTKERERLRKELASEQAARAQAQESAAREREITAALRAEGDALARQQLHNDEKRRALAQRLEHAERTVAELRDARARQGRELEEARERVRVLEEGEARLQSALAELRIASGVAAERLAASSADARSADGQLEELRNALERAWADATQLRKELRAQEVRLREEAEQRENRVRDEAARTLAEELSAHRKREDELRATVAELRAALSERREVQCSEARSVDELHQSLQHRVHTLEAELADARTQLATALRPVQRRVSELEQQLRLQHEAHTAVERSLRERLQHEEARVVEITQRQSELQTRLEEHTRQLKAATLAHRSARTELEQLQKTLQSAREDLRHTQEQLTHAHARNEDLQRELTRAHETLASTRAELSAERRAREEAEARALTRRDVRETEPAPQQLRQEDKQPRQTRDLEHDQEPRAPQRRAEEGDEDKDAAELRVTLREVCRVWLCVLLVSESLFACSSRQRRSVSQWCSSSLRSVSSCNASFAARRVCARN